MGRVGSALENAVAESFFSTLEHELLSKYRFATCGEARRRVACGSTSGTTRAEGTARAECAHPSTTNWPSPRWPRQHDRTLHETRGSSGDVTHLIVRPAFVAGRSTRGGSGVCGRRHRESLVAPTATPADRQRVSSLNVSELEAVTPTAPGLQRRASRVPFGSVLRRSRGTSGAPDPRRGTSSGRRGVARCGSRRARRR